MDMLTIFAWTNKVYPNLGLDIFGRSDLSLNKHGCEDFGRGLHSYVCQLVSRQKKIPTLNEGTYNIFIVTISSVESCLNRNFLKLNQ